MLHDVDKVFLSIIIINYRTPNMVTDCLESLIPELDSDEVRIVLVDNNSGDGSIEIIEKWLAKNNDNSLVLFIKSPANRGFSSGNNIGINAIEAKFYLLLNSDTLIRKGAIKQLLKTAENNESAGLITPRLEWLDTKEQVSCFNYISPISEFISSSKTAIITKIFRKYNVPIQVSNEISFPPWSSFACILVKKEVFDGVGLMDEGYFMYFEDAEFCYRAKRAGWKVLNEPSARIVHLRGGSSPVKENTRLRKRLPRYYYESRTRYFYQVYGWAGLTVANLLWSMGRLISRSRQLCGRDDKAASERQWLDIWTNWLQPLKSYTHPGSTKSK
ncbi:MAG: glycosyltransferase family 2 protein [Gammaproteobacteria bacterium]|nr:glycosyltransferase family 2 protein [Gammaproteobacteria bacterium]